ncbi:MAG TPA: low affinity iron permease family protein [Kofleriaceae bacterium]|jgi:low affinity Fe/Cu permease
MLHRFFRRFARATSQAIGSPYAFVLATLAVVVWALTGPVFGYSETWQLVINTGTTIVTFLVVFMIQNTQNRDSMALHLKIDELIRVMGEARNELVDVEDKSDEELERLQEEFKCLDDIRASNEELSVKKEREKREAKDKTEKRRRERHTSNGN